jgi:hypothetical protein
VFRRERTLGVGAARVIDELEGRRLKRGETESALRGQWRGARFLLAGPVTHASA